MLKKLVNYSNNVLKKVIIIIVHATENQISEEKVGGVIKSY